MQKQLLQQQHHQTLTHPLTEQSLLLAVPLRGFYVPPQKHNMSELFTLYPASSVPRVFTENPPLLQDIRNAFQDDETYGVGDLLTVRKGGRIVGVAHVSPDFPFPKMFHVNTVAVFKEHRRQGVCSRMLRKLGMLPEYSNSTLWLEVAETNPAVGCYERAGFQYAGPSPLLPEHSLYVKRT